MSYRYQYKYEWLVLLRERWIIILSVITLFLFIYAAFSGRERVEERKRPIAVAREEMKANDERLKLLIDSVERGLKSGLSPWQNPQRLNVVGQQAARVAAFDPQPLALIATGQSDLFTHVVKPRLYGEAQTLGFSELSNPVQLLFGNFDLAFTIIYLLPLLVLAFSYNLLSAEKESGSLRLTLAQPVGVTRWLFNKISVRFLVLSVLVIISLLVALILAGVSVSEQGSGILRMLIAILLYMIFWFGLSFLINLRGYSSGQNAVILVSAWVLLVLLVPATISHLANHLYPVPSRVVMLTELRYAEAEAQKKADSILESYYRDHPELMPAQSSGQHLYIFWIKYFAAQEEIRKAMQTVLNAYEDKLQAQQRTVDRLRFLSPAILIQNVLNEIAGTSTRHYNSYRAQVVAFAETWRQFFVPKIFRNELMKKEWIDELPSFTWDEKLVEKQYLADTLALIAYAVITFGVAIWLQRSLLKRELIISA